MFKNKISRILKLAGFLDKALIYAKFLMLLSKHTQKNHKCNHNLPNLSGTSVVRKSFSFVCVSGDTFFKFSASDPKIIKAT